VNHRICKKVNITSSLVLFLFIYFLLILLENFFFNQTIFIQNNFTQTIIAQIIFILFSLLSINFINTINVLE